MKDGWQNLSIFLAGMLASLAAAFFVFSNGSISRVEAKEVVGEQLSPVRKDLDRHSGQIDSLTAAVNAMAVQQSVTNTKLEAIIQEVRRIRRD